VLLENAKGEYGGADAVKDFPFAEGTVFVDKSDLMIGTLYTYRETVETAADPVSSPSVSRVAVAAKVHLRRAVRCARLQAKRLAFPRGKGRDGAGAGTGARVLLVCGGVEPEMLADVERFPAEPRVRGDGGLEIPVGREELGYDLPPVVEAVGWKVGGTMLTTRCLPATARRNACSSVTSSVSSAAPARESATVTRVSGTSRR